MQKTFVKLSPTDSKNPDKATTEFEIGQANKLLKLPGSKWKLNDANFVMNETEIAPKTPKAKSETK